MHWHWRRNHRFTEQLSTGAYYPPVVTAGRFLLPEHPTWQWGHCAVEPKITWAKKPIISISEVRLECKLLRRQPSASSTLCNFLVCLFFKEDYKHICLCLSTTTIRLSFLQLLFLKWDDKWMKQILHFVPILAFFCFAGTTLVIGGSTKGRCKWQEEPEGEGGGWILLHFAFFA